MKLEELKTIKQLNQLLDGTQAVIFQTNSIKKERYDWMTSKTGPSKTDSKTGQPSNPSSNL
ncbi:MAG: hypothetical protein KAI22_12230 [Gammaproteobacteria bacterium]|nr:hypothetical protein [Gammaproteobacteria bacterium]